MLPCLSHNLLHVCWCHRRSNVTLLIAWSLMDHSCSEFCVSVVPTTSSDTNLFTTSLSVHMLTRCLNSYHSMVPLIPLILPYDYSMLLLSMTEKKASVMCVNILLFPSNTFPHLLSYNPCLLFLLNAEFPSFMYSTAAYLWIFILLN